MATEASHSKVITIDSLEDFKFNESAEFHSLISPITEEDLQSVYSQDGDDDGEHYAVKTNLLQNKLNGLNYCFFAFKKQESKPTFCKQKIKDLQEQKTGYFLIVYNDNMSAMFRQNISLTDQLSSKQRNLSYKDLLDYNVSKDTQYKYLNMQGIDGAEYAIRSKTFEGKDLKRNVSALSSSRFFIKSMRGMYGKKSFSMNLSTSRLNHYNPGKTIDEITEWVQDSFAIFSKPNKQKKIDKFLDNFAKRTVFTSFGDFEPSHLLLNFATILRILENENTRVLREDNDYKYDFINTFEKIDKALPVKLVNSKYIVKLGKTQLTLCAENNKIRIDCDEWEKIKIENSPIDDYNGNLCEIMNQHGFFNVYFKDRRCTFPSVKSIIHEKRAF